MKRILFFLLSFVLVVLITGAVLFYPLLTDKFGKKPLPDIPDPDHTSYESADSTYRAVLPTLDSILVATARQLEAPSVSAAIGIGEEIIWANAAGYADIDAGLKANTSTRFRIGSVTKPVTIMGVGKLLESGQMELDRSVQSYVPYFDQSKPPITIRQLASHTSGIRNYAFCFCIPAHESFNDEPFTSVEQSVAVFGDDKLLFAPGTDFSYATYNYTLIGAAMEEITDLSYLEFMDQAVFRPLDMVHTMGDLKGEKIANRAVFYSVKNRKYKKAFAVDNSNKWAGGGLISTPSDLVKMGNALLSDHFLRPDTRAELWKPQTLADGQVNPQHYGIGWRIDDTERVVEGRKIRIIHHGGISAGGITLLILFPEYQMTTAIMINRTGSSSELFRPVFLLAREIIQALEEK